MPGGDDKSRLPGEFSLIANLFAPLAGEGAFSLQDDAALFTPTPGRQLVLTKDAIAEGRHYLADDPPGDVARKLLRVNLSDLAAKGATPRGYLLSCAWSETTPLEWMTAFVAGLAADQKLFGVDLLGGDTIQISGPSVFSLTAIGDVAAGGMIRRSGAQVGDDLWVTGTIGDGALGLLAARGELDFLDVTEIAYLVQRYRIPEPPVAFGKGMSGFASAALDVSDGLVADLGHLCTASMVGAEIIQEALPLSAAGRACVEADPRSWELILTGGDDYQIAFAASPSMRSAVKQLAQETGFVLTRIGVMAGGAPSVRVLDPAGRALDLARTGFRHF